MVATFGRRLRDGCLALGSISTIVGGVAAIDAEARHYLLDALHGELPPALANLPVQHLARSVADAVPIGGSAMMALGASALVLVFLTFRT